MVSSLIVAVGRCRSLASDSPLVGKAVCLTPAGMLKKTKQNKTITKSQQFNKNGQNIKTDTSEKYVKMSNLTSNREMQNSTSPGIDPSA